MPGRRAIRLLAGAAALLTACGSGSDDDGVVVGVPLTTSTTAAAATTTASPPGPSPAPAPTADATAAGDFTRGPVSAPAPAPGEPALLRAVRAAGQQGFDRVVFEFVADLPGYKVEYVERPVREDGSGKEVAVAGAAMLEVRMSPASGAEVSAAGVRMTYTGPDRLRPRDGTVVTEVVRVGDFEGQLTWVVGTSTRAPFKVTALGAPARLVIDVRSS
ncbi:MAG TPA: hypothetical protein VHF24_05550 [Acidimicrobiales bacterium]|nr:hypothetical protein [Acidimicrobiales bacterium]